MPNLPASFPFFVGPVSLASLPGMGRGWGGMLGRDLGVKFQRGSRNPASVILSSGYQTGHFVSNTLRGREISVKIKRQES